MSPVVSGWASRELLLVHFISGAMWALTCQPEPSSPAASWCMSAHTGATEEPKLMIACISSQVLGTLNVMGPPPQAEQHISSTEQTLLPAENIPKCVALLRSQRNPMCLPPLFGGVLVVYVSVFLQIQHREDQNTFLSNRVRTFSSKWRHCGRSSLSPHNFIITFYGENLRLEARYELRSV